VSDNAEEWEALSNSLPQASETMTSILAAKPRMVVPYLVVLVVEQVLVIGILLLY
jgi:hypothetical protein